MLGQLQLEVVHARLDELAKIANERKAECSDTFVTTRGGAGIEFLTQDERAEMHALKMQLPTYAQMRHEARVRIAERVANRRRGRPAVQ